MSTNHPSVNDSERLFVGKYPCGLVYADRTVEESGDYKQLAFFCYSTLEISFQADCPDHLKRKILLDCQHLIDMKGQQYEITSSGQTVTLGSRLE